MKIRIGTRKSALAIWQTEFAIRQIKKIAPDLEFEIVKVVTSGDKILDQNLYDIGGKGLFLKEIEKKLLDKEIDIAVHSLKDVPGRLPEGLKIAGVLERGDPRDVLVSTKYKTIDSIPNGTIVGTSSVRRQAILSSLGKNFKHIIYRGSVKTRFDKVLSGNVNAAILAAAGLSRLGMLDSIFCTPIDPDIMLPAAGQGIIAFEIREDDAKISELVALVNHEPTWHIAEAERSFLSYLDASCRTPISAYAIYEYGRIKARYMIKNETSGDLIYHTEIGSIQDASKLGIFAAEKINLL